VHHFIPIPEFPESYLLAADLEPAETAVVFAHGFLGDAYGSWVDFQTRIDRESWWARVDLYFVQYDSFGDSVSGGADVLFKLVEFLEKPPAHWFEVPEESMPPMIRESLGRFRLRSEATNYQQLVLVGHSQGGVVLREMILRHARSYVAQLENATSASVPVPRILEAALRLFAPAISGARPAGLVGIAMRILGVGGLARLMLSFSPSYAELLPQGGVVGDLRAKTEMLAKRFPAVNAFRADVLWAEHDNIVIDREYFSDRNHGRVAGEHHQSVCKPRLGYRRPLDLVTLEI
jgi:pimeloyl-ACP methyl ester carboxylesterase